MTLAEVEDLLGVIEKSCNSQAWVHPATGDILSAGQVDLYALAYNYISPATTLGTVVLQGLQEGRDYREGMLVEQSGTRAVGRVKSDCYGTDVEVEVLRGMFRVPTRSESMQLAVEGHDCGPLRAIHVPNSVSYKELIGKKPERPLWYCTHWWGEKVLDFIAGCSEHARRRNLANTTASYWVCGYANRQNSLSREISADPTQSSFYKAMCLAEGVLLLLDDGANVFSRIWCDFELYVNLTSASKKLDIVTVQTNDQQRHARLLSTGRLPYETAHDQSKREHDFPITLFMSGLCVNLEDGKASVEADRQHILKYLVQGGGLAKANRCLHSLFAKAVWPQALRRGIVEDFDGDEPGNISLPEVLSMDEGRKQLDMSFAHMEEVDVQAMRSIGRGLPPNLQQLALGFEGCSNVTDEGLEELARGFPCSIEVLKLDFLGCKKVTDLGISSLAAAMPRGVVEVMLHCDNCTHVGFDSLQAIADSLPKSCRQFRGTFCGTKIDCNFRSLADLRSRVQAYQRKGG